MSVLNPIKYCGLTKISEMRDCVGMQLDHSAARNTSNSTIPGKKHLVYRW